MCFAFIIYLLGKVICDKPVAGSNKLVNAEVIQSGCVRPSLAQMFCWRFRDCFAGSQPLKWISYMLVQNWKQSFFACAPSSFCFSIPPHSSTLLPHKAFSLHSMSMCKDWKWFLICSTILRLVYYSFPLKHLVESYWDF